MPKNILKKMQHAKMKKIMFTYHIFTLNIQTDIAEQGQPSKVGNLADKEKKDWGSSQQLSVTGKNSFHVTAIAHYDRVLNYDFYEEKKMTGDFEHCIYMLRLRLIKIKRFIYVTYNF